MKRGIVISIGESCMLISGYFLSRLVLDLIPTINPSHSSLIIDVNYHMLSLSNQLSLVSQFGIIILVLGIIVFFIDRIKSKRFEKSTN